jgi:hypothetical protein
MSTKDEEDEKHNEEEHSEVDEDYQDDTDYEEMQKQLRVKRFGPQLLFPNDLQSQRERALASMNKYLAAPPGDDLDVADSTNARRQYTMLAWKR